MILEHGAKLGPYEILEPLGAGGMGEVYKARDTRLDRTVAVKISTEQFTQRFEREARAVAALNHPHVCTLHDVGPNYLVMEYIEGPTLAERIHAGAIPLQEALPIGRQIVEALEAAHEKGVVHRDMKPANIKVSREGIVKVLDFGLAKALNTEPTSGVTATSPTLTIHASIAGIILGTAAYMSPEQAKGKPVDRRADIWAFGVVLYEMLTAKPLYTGENISETLAAVIMKEPDLSGLPANTPAIVKKLLGRALDRDAQQRLQAIGEARIALERAMRSEGGDDRPSEATPSRRAVLPWAAAALPLVAAIVLGVQLWRATRPVDRPLLSLSVDLGPEAMPGPQTTAAISPDGTRMVYPIHSADGKQALAARLLNQANGSLLAGTEGGINPFFSPDGQWIGFFSRGKLKKVSATGGAPVALCDAASGRGGTWGEDGYIGHTRQQHRPRADSRRRRDPAIADQTGRHR
jgi:serine/threonine-protein kinase